MSSFPLEMLLASLGFLCLRCTHPESLYCSLQAWLVYSNSSQNSWKRVICRRFVIQVDVGLMHPPQHASCRSLHKLDNAEAPQILSFQVFVEASSCTHGWLNSSLLKTNLDFISLLVPRGCGQDWNPSRTITSFCWPILILISMYKETFTTAVPWFQALCVRKWAQRSNINFTALYLTAYINISSKWVKDIKTRVELKFLDANVGISHQDLRSVKGFSDRSPKAQTTKENINS